MYRCCLISFSFFRSSLTGDFFHSVLLFFFLQASIQPNNIEKYLKLIMILYIIFSYFVIVIVVVLVIFFFFSFVQFIYSFYFGCYYYGFMKILKSITGIMCNIFKLHCQPCCCFYLPSSSAFC